MKLVMLIVAMLFLSSNLFGMSSPKNTETLNGMSSYQIRVLSTSPVNIQGIVSYYDSTGKAQTTRFFGTTPMVYEIDSLEGIMAAVNINSITPSFGRMQPMTGLDGDRSARIRVVLFKGSQFIDEKSSFGDFGEITISNGKFPYENLGLMLLP